MCENKIINLGRHKLLCGDACELDDLKKLIGDNKINLCLTDPPYGQNLQTPSGVIGGIGNISYFEGIKNPYQLNIKFKKMRNNENTDAAKNFYKIVSENFCKKFIIFGGNHFSGFLKPNPGWLVWNKKIPAGLNFSQCELLYKSWGNSVRIYNFLWNGVCRQGSPKLNPVPRIVPTQKPVELIAQILEDFSKPGDIVLDCFGGSGSVLIACELTGRICYTLEIEDEYINLISERYKNLFENKNKNLKEKYEEA